MACISIVIPTHDRWHLLRRTLAGALAQSDVDLEVLVVDDGSTDETPARLAAHEDPRLRVLRNEQATGVAAARNRGVEAAEGEWIAFLDDDDIWSREKLRRQLDAAEAAGAPFAYTSAVVVDQELTVLEEQPAPAPAEVLAQTLAFCAIPGGCSNVLARRELVRAVGGFDPELPAAEDWDMWIKMLLESDGAAARTPEPLYAYLLHEHNSVLANRSVTLHGFAEIRDRHAEARRARGIELDEVTHSRWLAGNYRRVGDRRGAAAVYLRGAWAQRNVGNVIRAGALLFGESTASKVSGRGAETVSSEAESWLALYRLGGPLSGELAGVAGA